jgi:hypothetical protein
MEPFTIVGAVLVVQASVTIGAGNKTRNGCVFRSTKWYITDSGRYVPFSLLF